MSLYFDKTSIANNRNTSAQHQFMCQHRNYREGVETAFNEMAANASAPVPYPVYADMDRQTKAIITDPTADVLYRDLMPLARPLDIGKMIHQYRRSSDSGAVTTSMGGLEPIPEDQTVYDYDGAVIPVHSSGFYREWRELAGQRSEGFDDLIDDQAGSVRTVRKKVVDYFLDGDATCNFKGVTSYGLRSGKNVTKGQLSVDLTSQATTGEQFRNEFLRILNIARNGSRIPDPRTVYISLEIESQLDRKAYAEQGAMSKTIRQELLELTGVKEIKATSRLSGNELLQGVLSQEHIMPLVGQAVSTVALPRQTPFARHQFLVWTAAGLEVRADYNGRTAWSYWTK